MAEKLLGFQQRDDEIRKLEAQLERLGQALAAHPSHHMGWDAMSRWQDEVKVLLEQPEIAALLEAARARYEKAAADAAVVTKGSSYISEPTIAALDTRLKALTEPCSTCVAVEDDGWATGCPDCAGERRIRPYKKGLESWFARQCETCGGSGKRDYHDSGCAAVVTDTDDCNCTRPVCPACNGRKTAEERLHRSYGPDASEHYDPVVTEMDALRMLAATGNEQAAGLVTLIAQVLAAEGGR